MLHLIRLERYLKFYLKYAIKHSRLNQVYNFFGLTHFETIVNNIPSHVHTILWRLSLASNYENMKLWKWYHSQYKSARWLKCPKSECDIIMHRKWVNRQNFQSQSIYHFGKLISQILFSLNTYINWISIIGSM